MRSTAILVLGMHRSGTSATTGVLQALGVDLGPHLMAPAPDNPKGFFEHYEIVAIHDELLAALGRSWDDPRPFPEGWIDDERIIPYTQRLEAIVQRDFADKAIWALKDPRLCRLLPLWIPMIERLGMEARFLHVLRHPAQVAASLKARNGFDPDKSGLLWLRHFLESEQETRGRTRIFMHYDRLLKDWQGEAMRIGRELKLEWPLSIDGAYSHISGFLAQSLKHHKEFIYAVFVDPFKPWLESAYGDRMDLLRDHPGSQARLDQIRRDMHKYNLFAHAAWHTPFALTEDKARQDREALGKARRELDMMQEQLEETKNKLLLDSKKLKNTEDEANRLCNEFNLLRGSRFCRLAENLRRSMNIGRQLLHLINK